MKTCIVIGIHAISRRLQQAPEQCVRLICSEQRNSRVSRLVEQATSAGVEISYQSRDALTRSSGTDKHQGCLLETRDTAPVMDFQQCLQTINPQTLFLVLDGIQDPHNLGACLRTSDACGVDAVIIPRDRAVKVNATVRKVAAGGAESVPVIEVTNLARSLKELKQAGVWVFGTTDTATDSLYDHQYNGPVALVMGSEGTGLRRLTLESCDHLLKLPMHGLVESLNVSVATGVCLYEIRRARSACGQA